MERKLVRVEKVLGIKPIENADNIEVAVIQNWEVVVKKNEFAVGQYVVYCEIDSFLPEYPVLEFLRKSCWRQHPITKDYGYRLKTIRLRGQISQGLVLPLDILNGVDYVLEQGFDLTELLGVIKWEDLIPAQLAGKVKGLFPSFIPKTDEERIQNLTEAYSKWVENNRSGERFYCTEKAEGTSFTCFVKNNEFGVCSRNYELLETADNALWQVARIYDLENKLLSFYKVFNREIAVQGELVGPGVQGNIYGLKTLRLLVFTVIDIKTRQKVDVREFYDIVEILGLETCVLLDDDFQLPETIELLLYNAQGKSALNPKQEREGIVIRNSDNSISFKAISNKYLLGK